MNGNERHATIEDVATAAGVSVATVSRALRGLPNVAPSTRQRVVDAAVRLQYQPDPSATRLAQGRSRTVAMAVPVLNSWYFSQVMAGAEAVLTEAGYDLLLFTVDSRTSSLRLGRSPLLGRAEGLIVVDLRLPPDQAHALTRSGLEVVTVGLDVEGMSSVRIDDVAVARTAVRHLVELGHRSIGLISGLPDNPLRFIVPTDRRAGYAAALHEGGIPLRPELECAGNFSVAGGAEAMTQLLALDDPPTAVFAMSDEMAIGALGAIWRSGRRTPRDVSIVGVDDHDVSEVLGLTTVRQAVPEHGALAAQLLLDRLEGSGPRGREPVRVEPSIDLVLRSTTGPPP